MSPVDRGVGAQAPRQRGPVLTAGARQDSRAAKLGKLDGERAYTPARRVNDNGLAALEVQGIVHPLQRSQPGERDRAGVLQVQRRRHSRRVLGPGHDILGMKAAPGLEARCVDVVADLQSAHARSHGGGHVPDPSVPSTGGIAALRRWVTSPPEWRRSPPREPRGVHGDQHFPGIHCRNWQSVGRSLLLDRRAGR